MAALQLNLLLFFIKLSKLKTNSCLPLAACIQLAGFFASVDLLEVSPVGRNHLACIDGLQERERGGESGQQSLRLKRLVVPSICFFSRVIPYHLCIKGRKGRENFKSAYSQAVVKQNLLTLT